MDELKTALTKVLANTFVMYFKAHAYHWNVEGMFFPQFHEFFGNLYEELHGAVDPIAEHIRAIDGYAPASLSDIKSASVIAESMLITEPKQMISNLISDNNLVIITAILYVRINNFIKDRLND